MVVQDTIPAFIDGNVFVEQDSTNKLISASGNGVIKIFDLSGTDLEPEAMDIIENLTSFAVHGKKALITSTSGELELINLSTKKSEDKLTRSELPLRDCCFINNGNRAVTGGDDSNLLIIDLKNDNQETKFPINEQLINLSYNQVFELLSVSLSNGDLRIYSMVNEEPSLEETIRNNLPKKVNTSTDALVYNDENKDDLITCKSCWHPNGELLAVPTSSCTIKIYNRSNWKAEEYELQQARTTPIIDLRFSPNGEYIAVLNIEKKLIIWNLHLRKIIKELDIKSLPINLAWSYKDDSNHYGISIGTTAGEIISIDDLIPKSPIASKKIDNRSLLAEMADESFGEESDDDLMAELPLLSPPRDTGEDDFLIDDDGEGYAEPNSHKRPGEEGDYYDDVEETDQERAHKRPKTSTGSFHVTNSYKIVPYSAGSTPWTGGDNDRRYLTMNSIGYAWAVKTSNNDQQSITISFFDRSLNKDYHFTDLYNYDLCSMNPNGVVFACSGNLNNKSKIYYRSHNNLQDSWEREIPIIRQSKEFLTSVTLSDSKIIVGSSLGYVRVFNIHGVCLSIEKLNPIVALASSNHLLFVISVIHSSFNYSIINLNNDNQYYQQNNALPLQFQNQNDILIKGIFFNEYNDPCLVGSDDMLLILANWRTPLQAKWIPILNIDDQVNIKNKNKDLKCWPLGLYTDKFNCIVIRGLNEKFPSFPLALPIELDIKLPVSKSQITLNEDGEEETDPEELFLRSMTMGSIVNESLNDEDVNKDDDIMERLRTYTMNFDKSLLKLFANACQDTKLSKAFSIIKLVRNDKALLAGSKIAERMEFITLSNRIGKLREDRIELDEDED